MQTDDERILYAIRNTQILRPPKQTLATFGTTDIYYYLVTEPSYRELVDSSAETVIREGRVTAQRPKVITPSYLFNLEGFSSQARRYFEMVIGEHGPNAPGLLYRYRNEPKDLTIASDELGLVVKRLEEMLDREGKPLTSIIKGVDELWDVCLMKFIHDLTASSLRSNVMELGMSGLLDVDSSGVTRDARNEIEVLFQQVKRGEAEPSRLKVELDRWGLFPEYEDRFLALFKKRQSL
ncbi:MAG: hypothetical protein ACE5IA_06510 [Dehalococcoidia bacterium]